MNIACLDVFLWGAIMFVSCLFLNFPLKKNHFLYLGWLMIRDFYINLC